MREQISQHSIPRRASAGHPVAKPDYAGLHSEDQPSQSSQRSQRQPNMYEEEDNVPDSYYSQRMPTSARRYRATNEDEQVIQRGNKRLIIHHELPPQLKRRHRRLHWLFLLGLGMFVMMSGWWLLTSIGTWWSNQQNTWTYGMPRTYQIDAVVGHHDSSANPSHFICVNYHGHIQVIEMPGGDATHEKTYIGPTIFTPDADLVPVTVSFQDVNADGKPDLLMHVEGQTIVFLNDGSQFVSPKE